MVAVLDALRRRVRRVHDDESGTSLAELLTGMAILAVFMAMFTGAIILMSSTVNKVEAVTTSSAQVNNAFLRLDKSVRYAAAITTIGKSTTSGDWYVEFDTTTTGSDVCTQLRIDGSQLQQRTWTASGTTYSNLSGWTMLANNVTNGTAASGSTDQPFTVPAASASASSGFQQLTITLTAGSGTATSAPTRTSMTFTALNSTASSTAAVCGQVTRP